MVVESPVEVDEQGAEVEHFVAAAELCERVVGVGQVSLVAPVREHSLTLKCSQR